MSFEKTTLQINMVHTRYLRARRLNPFVFSKWSTSRPGVAEIVTTEFYLVRAVTLDSIFLLQRYRFSII